MQHGSSEKTPHLPQIKYQVTVNRPKRHKRLAAWRERTAELGSLIYLKGKYETQKQHKTAGRKWQSEVMVMPRTKRSLFEIG